MPALPETTKALLAFLGIVSQFGGALLLVVLFVLLRRYANRRTYFRAWFAAWIALTVAIAAVAVRYVPILSLGTPPELEMKVAVRLLYFVYQFGKLLFFYLLAVGAIAYARETDVARLARWGIAGAGALAALTTGVSGALNQVLAWQAPVAIAASIGAAVAMLVLPPERRTLGSRVTGACFTALAGVWLLYLLRLAVWPTALYWFSTVLDVLSGYNSFVDLLLQVLLGYGMILLLMEDGWREVEDGRERLRVANDDLRRSALVDALTGAWNRRAFTEAVGWEVVRGGPGAVVMLDVDGLKRLNDRHGHAAGDALLRRTAELLRETVRPTDILYRWGGDEFLLIFPRGRAEQVVERVTATLDAAPALVLSGGAPVRVEASVGAADYADAAGVTVAVERADAAMYRKKGARKSGESRSA